MLSRRGNGTDINAPRTISSAHEKGDLPVFSSLREQPDNPAELPCANESLRAFDWRQPAMAALPLQGSFWLNSDRDPFATGFVLAVTDSR